MKLLLGVVVLLVVGCTSPNPKSCLDGTCTDPRYPFCDENGVIADNPKTCIAVDCAPGEIVECRQDTAVICNGAGTDYDLVQCALGCDLAGCRMCASDADCPEPARGICEEEASTCRGCTVDAECESQVCNDDGSCLAVRDAVFASPTGAQNSACSVSEPCSLDRAFSIASGAAVPPVLRMLPGVYASPVLWRKEPPLGPKVKIIGTGATQTGLVEIVGLNVEFEDLEFRPQTTVNQHAVMCGVHASASSGTSHPATLTLKNVVVATTNGGAVRGLRCTLTLNESRLEARYDPLVLGSSTLQAERVRFTATDSGRVLVSGTSNYIRVTNSIFDKVSIQTSNNVDSGPPGSNHYYAFNTFYLDGMFSNSIVCTVQPTPAVGVARFENNIIYSGSSTSAVINNNPAGCEFHRNVIFPFTGAPLNNIVMPPLFMDTAARDFRLMATSPARDAALPSSELTTDHDFTGAPRPAGAAMDIGAYEFQ